MTAGLPDRGADREREWCPECAGHRTVRVISATHAISVACPACTGGPLAAAALAARPAPDDGEALPGPLDDRCGCRRGMGRRDPACHSYGLCGHAAPSSPGSGDALHDKLAEALPEAFGWARWDVAVIRRAATALLPVLREAIADAVATELEGWATSFRAVGAAAIRRENKRVYPQVADVLEAGARDVRADALRDGTRP